MYVFYNPNPTGRMVNDCAIRAVSKALNIDWDSAYLMITAKGYAMKDMPSSNSVWGAVLRDNGFNRQSLPNECPDCYTAMDFCRDNPSGTYVLGFGSHTACVQDGRLFDSWNSLSETPQYFWYRKEERRNDLPSLLKFGKLGSRSSGNSEPCDSTAELL